MVMNRAATATAALAAFVFSAVAESKDLAGVFEDAVHNDPVIRQADANRLAAREARPQAWSALLPQVNATAGVTREHSSGVQDQITPIPVQGKPGAEQLVILPLANTSDTTTKQWAVNLRENLFSWQNWMALKAAGKEVAQAE